MAQIDGFIRADIIIDSANDYIYSPQLAQQNDLRGRTLYVQVRDNGVVVDQTGLQLMLGWRHKEAKTTGLDSFTPADITEGVFSLPYPQTMLSPGTAICSIVVLDTSTGRLMHSRNFDLRIGSTAYEMDAVAADNSFTTLQQILQLWFDLPDNFAAATSAAIADFEEQAQAKLDAIRTYFRGNFPSLEELQTAVPTALAGDYAFVGTEGTDATMFIWDVTDSAWVQSGVSLELSPEMIASLYESVPGVNRYTNAEKQAAVDLADDFDGHVSETLAGTGAHGIRYMNEELQGLIAGVWLPLNVGGGGNYIEYMIPSSAWASGIAAITNADLGGLIELLAEPDMEVYPSYPPGMTAAEKTAYDTCFPVTNAQGVGSVSIKSWGTVPAADLRIALVIKTNKAKG